MSRGIRIRTLFTVIVPLLALALILGLYFIAVRIDDARRDLETQGQRYGEYLAAASEFNVIAGNHSALEDFVSSNMRVDERALAILILDDQDTVLVSAGDRKEVEVALICYYDPRACERYQSRLFYNQLIESVGVSVTANPELMPPDIASSISNDVVGRVLVTYNTDQLKALQQRMLFDGLAITGVAILIACMIALYFAEGISRPISRLSQVVNAIQRGNLKARTNPSSRGELRQLEEGVNEMATRVEQANINLQQRVEQATSDLLAAMDTLESKNSDLEIAREKAEEANKTKDLFLARMSHELRTPLASVIGYSRLQEAAEDPAKRRDYGKVVEQASKILLATIDDILDFIRLEDESIRLENIDFDLGECIKNVVAMQAPEAQRKHLDLICECANSLPKIVCGDSARLAQIATNLLSNAIKFTEKGQVKLHASAIYPSHDLAQITLVVSDTGIGIPKDKQAQLFQPFAQADESISRRFGGSGLGLSITRKLAQYMGGEVSLKSDTGEGVVVTVTVQMKISKEPLPEPVPALNNQQIGKEIKALLVEDNELNRQLISIQLQNYGVTVSSVSNGVEALGAVDNNRFDVIFMDVHMPGMDGVALASTFKEHAPQIPLYALTANITGSEEQDLLRAGVRRILYKPLNDESLHDILLKGIDPDEVLEDEQDQIGPSRLEVPPNIDGDRVLVEMLRQLEDIEESLDQREGDRLFDSSHKLLGMARLFTRGKVLAAAVTLEELARQRNYAQLKEILPELASEIAQLNPPNVINEP